MLCTATLTSTMFLHYAQVLQSVIILHVHTHTHTHTHTQTHTHTHTHFHHQQNVGAAVSHALLAS